MLHVRRAQVRKESACIPRSQKHTHAALYIIKVEMNKSRDPHTGTRA